MAKEKLMFGNEMLEQGVCGKEFGKRELSPEPICGTLILDLDGTLTLPGKNYAIDKRAILAVSEFVLRGGICALNTGATKERSERSFFNPLFCLLDEQCNFDEAVKIFSNRIWLLPENGSSVLKSSGVTVMENELWFTWDETNPLHVPDKEKLRYLIESDLVPRISESFVVGDRPGEIGRRNYILSWKGLKETPKLIDMIKSEIIPKTLNIDWEKIQMKAARTTIDFINSDSGKEQSTRIFLSKIGFNGPIVGFGDLGDEFGKVQGVTTFNVNTEKPNSFRTRDVSSLEVTDWQSVDVSECLIKDDDEVIFRGKKVEVLRDKNDEIIFAKTNEKGYLVPDISGKQPEKIIISKPLTSGAGEATAEILEGLMRVGYFDKDFS